MTLVFDTTALSELLSNNDEIVKVVSQKIYDRMAIPLATDAELRFGFAHGVKQTQNLENYELFRQQFNFEVILPDQDTAIIYSELASWARQHGISLSNNDVWIAATCKQISGRLLSYDRDFAHLPQISLVQL